MTGQHISHYRISEKLGEGGMGVVYKAQDTQLDRPVALKFLAPHLLRDEESRKRFRREAKAAASLDHPNICTVYEIGQADDQSFIAMAFLEGRTLKKKISDGPLKLPEVLAIAIQMAEGLEAARKRRRPPRHQARQRDADERVARACEADGLRAGATRPEFEAHPRRHDAGNSGLYVSRTSIG